MADQLFKIPLQNTPQVFDIELNERSFRMVCRWNPEMPAWTVCLLDGETQAPLVTCLPLVTGTDLLAQFQHLGIVGSLFVYVDGGAGTEEIPTLESLGKEANLYYYVP